MRVKIYKVKIPARSSREFDVPEYDVPILKELWPEAALIPGQRITVTDLGIADWREPNQEWARLEANYAAQVGGVAAFKAIYGTKESFLVAFRKAGEDGERFERKVAEFAATQPAPAAEEPAPALRNLADNLEDDPALDEPEAGVQADGAVANPPAPRGKPGRKPKVRDAEPFAV